MRRYEMMGHTYKTMKDMQKFVFENSTCPDKVKLQKAMQKMIRSYRDDMRSYIHSDPLEKPLTEQLRYKDDGDGCYIEYGILTEDGEFTTDEEIQQYIDEYIALPPICSPYDCTGKHFTWSIDWKRCKAGIAVIHHVGLDI